MASRRELMGNDDERRVFNLDAIGKGIAIAGIWISCAVATAYGAPHDIFVGAVVATVFIGMLF